MNTLSVFQLNICILIAVTIYYVNWRFVLFFCTGIFLVIWAIATWNCIIKLHKKTLSLTNILSNAIQGFIYFSEDMIIKEEYSKKCVEILGEIPAGNNFIEMFFSKDEEQKFSVKRIMEEILVENREWKIEILLPLLPQEVIINKKEIHIDYKIINGIEHERTKYFMVIITDISEIRCFENQLEQEQKRLKMVVKVAANADDFLECLHAFEFFYTEVVKSIFNNKNRIAELVYEIYRNVHTFKATFTRFEMVNLVEKLHGLENDLSELISSNNITMDGVKQFLKQYDMKSWADSDIKILNKELGEDYFNRWSRGVSLVELDNTNWNNNNTTLVNENIVKQIDQLEQRSIFSIICSYSCYVISLAEKMNKKILPLKIIGDNVIVEYQRYQRFFISLVHVFRNMIVHGIEEPKIRKKKNKNAYGEIICKVIGRKEGFTLVLYDDGKGIEYNKEKYRSVFNNAQSSNYSSCEWNEYLFVDGVTSETSVDEYSGRGMGLSTIKYEVERLKGNINVFSEKDSGTRFIIDIPFLTM